MILLRNGNLHIGDGNILPNCDLLTNGKVIEKIGRGLQAPGADVLDFSGCEVFPGFIDAHSPLGAISGPTRYPDNAEHSAPVQLDADIRYSADPAEIANQEYFRSGITSLLLSPDNGNVVGGKTALYKTGGAKAAPHLALPGASLKCSVTETVKNVYALKGVPPMTKMGIFALLENTFCPEFPAEGKEEHAVIRQVLDGRLPVLCAAHTATEIESLAEVFGSTDAVIYLADPYQFHLADEDVLERFAGLVFGDTSLYSMPSRYGFSPRELASYVSRGGLVALSVGAAGLPSGRETLLWTAADLYRAGIPAEDIVSMMTLNPAEILGLDGRLGALREGYAADISVFSAHPVKSYGAKLLYCIIEGARHYG